MLEEDRKFYEIFPATKKATTEQWMYWLQQEGHCINCRGLQQTPEPLCHHAPTPVYFIPLPPPYHPTQVANVCDFTHHMDFQHKYNYNCSPFAASDSEFHHRTAGQSLQEAIRQPSIVRLLYFSVSP